MKQLQKLYSQLRGPEGAPVVTFVPGIGNDSEFWGDQADRLVGDFQVLTFDPWGHGNSPPPPDDCRFQDVVDGLIQLLDQHKIERTVLIGLGFGGSVAFATALDHSSRITQLIACCCRARQPDDRREFWRERQAKATEIGMDRLADMTVDRWLSEDFRSANADIDATLRTMMKRTTVAGYLAYVGAFIEMDFSDRLADMKVPTMLIAAEKDHGGGPPEDMRAMAAVISDAQYEMVPHAGHIVNFEAPDALAKLISDFLIKDKR